MTMRKQPQIELSSKDYIKGELADNKVWIFSIVLFMGLWIFGIIVYNTYIFQLIMIIFSILYVIILFIKYIGSSSNYSFVLDTVQNNPDIQKFNEIIKNLDETELQNLIEKIIESEKE